MLTSNLQRTRSSEIPDGTVHHAPLGLDAYSGMDQPIFAQRETMKETEWTPNPDDSISYFRMITDQGYCTDAVRKHVYSGNGTEEDPFVISWLVDDSRNPYNWSLNRRAFLTAAVAMPLMATALGSSAYTGSNVQILQDFPVSNELVTLGLSLYVLGFALGPLVWAPLSELYGRQVVFVTTFAAFAAFNAGCATAPNIATLLVLRFFAGSIGSSPLANAGGQVADMFGPRQVGLAMSLFCLAPFLGPALGPVIGGFISESIGWRWVEWFLAIFTGVLWLTSSLVMPETYAPVLLRRRAQKLSKITGRVYKSKLDLERGQVSNIAVFGKYLGRPWLLLLFEPILLILAIYNAVVYGTLYMFFSAFPIVFQEKRGWSQGIGGLAFMGIAIGFVLGCAYAVPENIRYNKLVSKAGGGLVPPEQRLVPAMVATPGIPIGLFWFAWTNYPSISPFVCIAAGIPFAFGNLMIYLSITNYQIDAYTVYSASALCSNTILRSLFGFAFPLFADVMYRNLGIHWASSIPAFLALTFVPVPFVLYKYGHVIRKKCRYAAEAERVRIMIQEKQGRQKNEDGP